MKTQLQINPAFVPTEVTNGYLHGYSSEVLKQLVELSKKFEEREFRKTQYRLSASPVFTIVAGTTGVGKSIVVEPLAKDSVVCDAFELLKEIPAFRDEWMAGILSEDSANGTIYATRMFHPGAKWVTDRGMTEGLLSGRNVTLETEAQAPGIGNLMDNVAARGITINTHICQAPFDVKLAGAYAHSKTHHDTVVDVEKMRETNLRMIKNMPVLAAKTNGVLTIHFRDNSNKPLEVVAVSKSDRAFDYIPALARRFENEFGNGLMGQLMGERRIGTAVQLVSATPQALAHPALVM